MAKQTIQLTESELKNIIYEAISEMGGGIHPNGQIDMFQNQDEVDNEHSEANDEAFYRFEDTLGKCGWSFTDYNEKDNGVVYVVEPDGRRSCSKEELQQYIFANVPNSKYIKFGIRTNPYASEMKKLLVFIPYHENIQFVNESKKIKKTVKQLNERRYISEATAIFKPYEMLDMFYMKTKDEDLYEQYLDEMDNLDDEYKVNITITHDSGSWDEPPYTEIEIDEDDVQDVYAQINKIPNEKLRKMMKDCFDGWLADLEAGEVSYREYDFEPSYGD